MEFDVKKEKERVISWIREFFLKNGPDCNAVLGISGGKDSSVAAALCVQALGKDRVIGVLMPNGVQADIEDSKKVCELLGIKNYTVNINDAFAILQNSIEIGFENAGDLTGGIQSTGNYPYKARNFAELTKDLDESLKYIPGKKKMNLHASYQVNDICDRKDISPKQFEPWVEYAKERKMFL